MKRFLLLTILSIPLLLISCGKKKSGGARQVAQPLPLEPEGIFSATLYSVNKKVSDKLNGQVTISKYGDFLNVRIKIKDAPTGTHLQGLYTGEACPYEDVNADGYVDIKEAEKFIRRMLIPFDGDIGSLALGNEFYPTDDYKYERTASYGLMLSDLQPDERNISLEGKVVVIHGVAETELLPSTLATAGVDTPQKTIPIACGVLSHVTYDPGEDVEELPEPDVTPITVSPGDDTDPSAEPWPDEDRPRTGRWGRFRDRLERWWRRIVGKDDF